MTMPLDTADKLREYAHPEKIVTTDWVAEHLDDPGLVVAESDEDVLLSELAIVWRIMVPMATPSVIAFSIFSVVAHWNDLFWPLIAVRDVRASSRWYSELLGVSGLPEHPHRDYYDALSSSGRMALQLHAWDEENHPNLVNRAAAPPHRCARGSDQG